MSDNYSLYSAKLREIADLNNAAAVLGWDQEVYMPPQSAATRSRQLSTLSGLVHDLFSSKELGDWLEQLEADGSLDVVQQANVRESLRDYRKAQRYNREFVEQLSQARSDAFVMWRKARDANDFEPYRPALERMVELKKREADLLGFEDHPYDALMDAYEKGARTAHLKELFAGVRTRLHEFVQQIQARPQVDDSFLRGHFQQEVQWQFGIDVLKSMGYDFNRGRQDISTHPFTTSFGPNDVRVTTRVSEANFNEMLWSCIHEGGHALYEQGLPIEQYGLPAAEATSLGIHESQSRLWENNVGRALPFWTSFYPELQKRLPDAFGDVSLEQFYRAINKVKPSLIRTESDELTYHFHVMIRFEIEVGLIEGSLEVRDLPEIWADRYKTFLGLEVPDQKRGVLQDIHWSHGSIGYFPTYSLGSFYAAQLYQQATKDIPGLEKQLSTGQSSALLAWLRQHIHAHGRRFSSEELCLRITGQPLQFDCFMDYARRKYSGIYGIEVPKVAEAGA